MLFRSIDIASLVFFRIAFGLLGFIDVISTLIYKYWEKQIFDVEKFQFPYYGFEWVKPLPEPWMSLIFMSSLMASIGVLFGKWYRFSATVFALGFSYFFLLEKAYYLNHGYFFILLSFVMIFLPANQAFSLDALKKGQQLERIPYWPLFLLQFMMAVVYFYGGIAKINPDWLQAMPLKIWLKAKSDMPILGFLWTQEWVAYLMSYGGLFLDLFVVVFLINRKTRLWALGFVLFFHFVNLLLFQIGIFPFLSTALSLLFFPPDFPRKIIAWLFQRFLWLEKRIRNLPLVLPQTIPATTSLNEQPTISYNKKRWVTLIIGLFCLLHLVIPLRHHYFPGPVAWTEEGHRYAWRMMLRDKRGYGYFEVKTKEQEKTTKVRPEAFLNERQSRKMYTHPDMILQFAHFIRDKYEAEWNEEVEVYAQIKVKLNGRKYQRYIDPGRDLAREEWSFWKTSDWIVPFDDEQQKD